MTLLKKGCRKVFLFALILSCDFSPLGAETFRVHKTDIIELASPFDKQSVTMGVNDALAIKLPDDLTFIEGIEIALRVPEAVAEWRDSVAWSFYNGISPVPDTERIDYSGERVTVGTFEDSVFYTIKVPVKSENSIEEDGYSYLVSGVETGKNNTVFFRLQLAMKGSSDDVAKAVFKVTATLILSDKGMISVNAAAEDGDTKKFSVFVDERREDGDGKNIIAPEGVHTVSIVSDFYRNEVRTVTVERAKTANVDIVLRDIKPRVNLIAPENTKAVFDNQELTLPCEPFHTDAGEHIVRFYVGDYEIVKPVSLENGKNYSISINIEADITEEN